MELAPALDVFPIGPRLNALAVLRHGKGPPGRNFPTSAPDNLAVPAVVASPDPVHTSHTYERHLARKGRDLERQVLTRAVRMHLQRRVLVSGGRTIVFG